VKTEGAIWNEQSRDTGNIGNTRNRTKTQYNTENKTDEQHGPHHKNQGWLQILTRGKQFLLLIIKIRIKIRHPLCCSYIQSGKSLGSYIKPMVPSG